MKNKEIGSKRNKFGIPVVVLDLKTKESYDYVSIAEAARSFNTHPKTIWRIVYNNKLYLNRYQITEKINKDLNIVGFILLFKNNISKHYYKAFLVVKSNEIYFIRWILVIFFWFSFCIIIILLFIIIKDIFEEYIFAVRIGKGYYNKCVWEHKVLLNEVLYTTNNLFAKTSFNSFELLRYEDIYKYRWISVYNTNEGISIYQSIINEINYDFNVKGTEAFSGLNSSYSSPIIERVNINNIFSNAIATTNIFSDNANSLGIHGISNNRNSIIIDNSLMTTRIKTTELLNYQSNILYCLINGLSPSLY